jgi:hypothetical protein
VGQAEAKVLVAVLEEQAPTAKRCVDVSVVYSPLFPPILSTSASLKMTAWIDECE